MTPPTVIEEDAGPIVVRKRAGATEDRLEIRIAEVLCDVTHDMGEAGGAGEGRRRAPTCRRRWPPRRGSAARASGSCAASGRPTSARST